MMRPATAATQLNACQFSTALQKGHKFTGKERDADSGLDMFGARYYGSSLGRFMTPDWATKPTNVPYAHFGNPQSLNLYSYVQNNPTTVGDPDGLWAGGPHLSLPNLRVPHFSRSLREVGTVMRLGTVLDPANLKFVLLALFLYALFFEVTA
jgi:RHS repeat-associated protein